MYEHCCLCDGLTGRAGKDEDSIYVVLAEIQVGPLCVDCRNNFTVCEDCNYVVTDNDINEQGTHACCGGKCV